MITASIVAFHQTYEEMVKVLNCILHSPVSKIYIVDNSRNDALREVEKLSEIIRYIHNANIGYGAAHNIAIREAIKKGSKYHIVINPDIYFASGALEGIVQYMDDHEEIGLIMPKILYPDGKLQYLCKLLPTPMELLGRRFIPFRRFVDKKNKRYEMRFTDYNTIMEVPSLSGCFMFMRISVLRTVGGFDERFFMYAEDIDLCRRVGEVAKTVYFPEACVYHEYAKGSYKNRKLLRYHICSVIKYFNKWGWLFDSKRRIINRKIFENYFSVKV